MSTNLPRKAVIAISSFNGAHLSGRPQDRLVFYRGFASIPTFS